MVHVDKNVSLEQQNINSNFKIGTITLKMRIILKTVELAEIEKKKPHPRKKQTRMGMAKARGTGWILGIISIRTCAKI